MKRPTARWVRKRLRVPWVGLPNALAGRFVVPELLQEDATADNLAPKFSQVQYAGSEPWKPGYTGIWTVNEAASWSTKASGAGSRFSLGSRMSGLPSPTGSARTRAIAINEHNQIIGDNCYADCGNRSGPLSGSKFGVLWTLHRVARNGDPVHLGPTEFRLLRVLLERPGRVFSREQLLDAVWGRESEIEPRTVDVHIRRLRKALNEDSRRDLIRTVRAAGYAVDQTGR